MTPIFLAPCWSGGCWNYAPGEDEDVVRGQVQGRRPGSRTPGGMPRSEAALGTELGEEGAMHGRGEQPDNPLRAGPVLK